jgi:hypothetical protein
MTVQELREYLENMPGDLPVVIMSGGYEADPSVPGQVRVRAGGYWFCRWDGVPDDCLGCEQPYVYID